MGKLTKSQKMIVAAMFARTNMGQPPPSVEDVAQLFASNNRQPFTHLSMPVNTLCGQYMEADEHERIFLAEARGWLRDKNLNTLESITEIWPDAGQLIAAALAKAVVNAR